MSLRILLVEDDPNDAELELRRLRDAGLEPSAERVATPADLSRALDAETWDVALVDYNIPGFGGLQALETIAALAPDLPAITVSGAISEDTAVATITAGAMDYVLKDNLTRLAPAVRRALERAELRRQQRLAAAQARQSQFAVDHASQVIVYLSEDGRILYVNHAAEQFGGVPRDEVVGRPIWGWVPLVDEARWREIWQASTRQPIIGFEAAVRLPDGRERLVKATVDHLRPGDGDFVIAYVRDVTEERAAAERARETERRYERLTDNLHDIAFRVDLVPEPRLTFVSRAVETILGCTQEECCWHPEHLLQAEDPDRRSVLTDLVRTAEYMEEPLLVRRRDRDGAPQWLEFRTVAVRDDEGRMTAIEGIARDVTARRQDEEDLRFTRFVVEHAADHIFWMEADGSLKYANPAACAALGYHFDELTSMTIHDLDPKFPPERWPEHIRELKQAGSVTFESVHRRKDGTAIPTEITAAYLEYDGKGYDVGFARDITERKRSEAALTHSRDLLNYVVGHARTGIAIHDRDLRYIYVSQRYLEQYGIEEKDVIGRHHYDVFPDLPEKWREVHRRVLAGEVCAADRDPFPRGDGSLDWTRWECRPWYESDGSIGGIIVYTEVITEQVEAEHALRESEERYRAMFEKNRAIKLLIDAETAAIVDANQAAVDFYGYTHDELCALKVEDLNTLPPDEIRATIRSIGDEELSQFVFKHRLANGEIRDVEVNSGPLEAGGRTLLFSIVQDVTERVRAEETLRESETLLQQSQSAARVGHYVFDVAAGTWTSSAVLDDVFGIGPEYERDVQGWLGIVHADDRASMLAYLQGDVLGERGRFDREYRIVRIDDGEERWVHGLGELELDADGAPMRMFGVIQDVTERRAAEEAIRHHAEHLRRTVEGSVTAMSQIVESRDPYTAGHERRVSELAVAIAEEMGLERDRLAGLRLAALIHDIGKISVPAEILSKPGRLSQVEFNLIKQHAQAGYDILAAIEFDQPVAEIVLQHHERLDGSGYPQGLRDEQIMTQARILSVADVVEAMSSHRPYRPSLGMEPALEEIRRGAGTQYDADVAAACLRVVGEKGFTFSG